MKNARISESSKSRLEWHLKFISKLDLIKWSVISFRSWKLSSQTCQIVIHEHWATLEWMAAFLRQPSSKELNRFSCSILEVKLFQMKAFCIFCISSINCFENEIINVRYTILDTANVLKIIIFPSSVIFLILHKLKIFYILVMLFTKFCCICKFWL